MAVAILALLLENMAAMKSQLVVGWICQQRRADADQSYQPDLEGIMECIREGAFGFVMFRVVLRKFEVPYPGVDAFIKPRGLGHEGIKNYFFPVWRYKDTLGDFTSMHGHALFVSWRDLASKYTIVK